MERRAVKRSVPIKPLAAKVKASIPARVVDISARGLQIELATSLRPHAGCELRMQFDGGDISVRATVRRCRAWGFGLDEKDQRVLLYRAGLEFDEVSPAALEQLGRLTASEPEPPPPIPNGPSSGEPATHHVPPREGPIKVRISAEHVRAILDSGRKGKI